MQKHSGTVFFYYLTLSIIILFSFFNHSSLYSPKLNSDDAVVALMIHDFNLPEDLYYWGANRFGSLIPLIGQVFNKVFHLSAVASESVAHYLLLIAGFFCFAGLFQSGFIRLIFSVVWFLPPLRMLDILKLSQGEQYALIGIGAMLITKLYRSPDMTYRLREHLMLIFTALCFIAAAWVSDLAVITIFILILVFAVDFLKTNKAESGTGRFRKPEPYYILGSSLAGALFIYYAKMNAAGQDYYYDFFELQSTRESVNIFLKSLLDVFMFNIREPFTSIYAYGFILLLAVVLLNQKKIELGSQNTRWILVFTLDLVLVLAVILSSKWSYLNGVPRRYFVCSYISLWLIFLFLLDGLRKIKLRKILYPVTLVIALAGGLGTIFNFRYISPKRLTPAIQMAGEFKQLGDIGIIANYWNSYINAAADPEHIRATPHDKDLVRNRRMVDSVLARKDIYLISDMWLDSFPGSINQFGNTLMKAGDPFMLGGCEVCLYKKVDPEQIP